MRQVRRAVIAVGPVASGNPGSMAAEHACEPSSFPRGAPYKATESRNPVRKGCRIVRTRLGVAKDVSAQPGRRFPSQAKAGPWRHERSFTPWAPDARAQLSASAQELIIT